MSVVLNARTKNTLYVGGLETEVHESKSTLDT